MKKSVFVEILEFYEEDRTGYLIPKHDSESYNILPGKVREELLLDLDTKDSIALGILLQRGKTPEEKNIFLDRIQFPSEGRKAILDEWK